MNNGRRGIASGVAVAAALLFVGIVGSAAPGVRAAVAYRAPGLLEIFASVAALVALAAAGLVVALRRRSAAFGWSGMSLLILFGAPSAATGVSPGILFDSPWGALAFVIALAVIAGVIGAVRDRSLGWIATFVTLFAGAATAAFMVGWAPLIATLIVG